MMGSVVAEHRPTTSPWSCDHPHPYLTPVSRIAEPAMIRVFRAVLVGCCVMSSLTRASSAQPLRPTLSTLSQGRGTQGRDQEKPDPRREKPDPATAVPGEGTDPLSMARRPYRALFGGAVVEDQPSSGFRVSGALFGAWDENLLADLTGPNATLFQVSGGYVNLLGDVSYTRNTNRLQLVTTGGTNARYYTNLREFAATDYHAAIGVGGRVSELTTVSLNQAVSRAPVYLFSLFLDALPPAALGTVDNPGSSFAVNDDRSFNTDTSADIERRLTTRSFLRGNGAYRRTSYDIDTPRGSELQVVDVGGSYRYRLSEDNDFRLGYEFRQGTFSGPQLFGFVPQQPAEHNLHVGVALHPSLSDQRRTIVTFEGGTALVSSFLPDNAFVTRRQLRLVGDAAIAHQMGQTWLLVGAAKRGTGFVQGLTAPVFTDSVSATLSGFFNRRTDFAASVGYSNGEPSLVGSLVNFTTTTANARLRVALSPRWALTTEYVFYHYDFSRVLQLSAGLDPKVKRNTVRAGVDMWFPVRGR